MRKTSFAVAGLLMAGLLCSCGSDSAPPTAPTTAAPAPAAVISGQGGGSLVVHPSANPAYSVALETPLRISETGGGTADWNYARMSLLVRGAEIERSEFTANDIRGTSCARVAARSTQTCTAVFRFNSGDFDDIALSLGFSDLKDGRQITVAVPLSSFTDVTLGFTPLRLPRSGVPL